MVSCSHPSILLKHLHHEQGFCHFVNGIYPLKKEEARSHLFASHHIHLQRLASQFDTSEVDYFGRTRSTLEYSTGFLYNTMSYTPIVDDENSALLGEEPVAEVFPVKTVQNQDAAFAMRLAEREAAHCRQQEIEANARAWDAHYSRPNPYYYGTWRGPSLRPYNDNPDVDDPRVELYTFMCFSLGVSILLFTVIYLSYYYSK